MGDTREVTTKVLCEGWRDARNERRLSFMDALRRHADLSLSEAKKELDLFVSEGKLVVDLGTPERAAAFLNETSALGVMVCILDRDCT